MKRSYFYLITVCFLILCLSIAFLFGISPSHRRTGEVYFEVQPGQSSFEVAENLKRQGLIKSKWLFVFFLKISKGVIQAGTYQLNSSMNLFQITAEIKSGRVEEYTVTFPEGLTIKEMAEILKKKDILSEEDFLKEASLVVQYQERFPFLKGVRVNNLEGYLFPDTYRFSFHPTATEIVTKMLENFDRRVNQNLEDKIRQQNLTLNEVVILASIVEREAKKEEDRPIIASVYLNRLKKGMKLEADPTIQYAKGNWQPITKAEYHSVDSPYNTYRYGGLPPGPIANPGLKSILAVLQPAKTDFLYFFHTKSGEAIYSITEAEHEKKKQKYLLR